MPLLRTLSWVALAALLLGSWPDEIVSDAGASEAKAAGMPAPRADYPVPPADQRRLFFLQRSSNANTVVYDANLAAPGSLDPERPVEVYWLRYNTDGERKRLSFAERNFAYGVDVSPVDDALGGYRVRIAALTERPFRVFIDRTGAVQATMAIAGRPARLQSVYLELAEGGLVPRVRHIDIFGVELATGRRIHERIVP